MYIRTYTICDKLELRDMYIVTKKEPIKLKSVTAMYNIDLMNPFIIDIK